MPEVDLIWRHASRSHANSAPCDATWSVKEDFRRGFPELQRFLKFIYTNMIPLPTVFWWCACLYRYLSTLHDNKSKKINWHDSWSSHLNPRRSGKSLMYIRERGGPSTMPCGTPDLTCVQGECSPLTTTLCSRHVWNLEIQACVLLLMPYLFNPVMRDSVECFWEIHYDHVCLWLII